MRALPSFALACKLILKKLQKFYLSKTDTSMVGEWMVRFAIKIRVFLNIKVIERDEQISYANTIKIPLVNIIHSIYNQTGNFRNIQSLHTKIS